MNPTGAARIACALALALAAANLSYRLNAGEFRHGVLNAEAAVAFAFLVCLLAKQDRKDASRRPGFIAVSLAAPLILLSYRSTLHTPFLYDDYTHISDAAAASWQSILHAYGPLEHPPGLFFRPTGFAIYWMTYLWAGTNARLWHCLSLALHAANCCLLWLLCRRLALSGSAAVALFAAAAGSVEAVVWIDARFDLLAALFSLLTLLSVCRYVDTGGLRWILAAAAMAICGVTSKEAAFCVPILVASLVFFLPRTDRRRVAAASLWVGVAVAAVFVYRWWALGGIGGYRDAGGSPGVLHIDPLRVLNALALREWALLFFPVNWSLPPGAILRFALVTTPLIWLAALWMCKPARRQVIGSMILTGAAALPVTHLLMIGPDLSGARILYLPTIGWAMLWGAVFAGLQRTRDRNWLLAWMLVLESLTLHHNLRPWSTLPTEAQQVCSDFAQAVQGRKDRLAVHGLPRKINGVVMLANGFPECVRMNSGGTNPPLRITLGDEPADQHFDWNPRTHRIEARAAH